MKLREFSMGDYPAVRRLWEDSGLEIRPGDSREEVKKKLRRDRDLFLVAEESGEIVGTAMGTWDGRRGWIYHLGVSPSFQRRGVATTLVREIETRMRKKGVLKVNAIVFASNERSLRFFEKAGYRADRASVLHGKMLLEPGSLR